MKRMTTKKAERVTEKTAGAVTEEIAGRAPAAAGTNAWVAPSRKTGAAGISSRIFPAISSARGK